MLPRFQDHLCRSQHGLRCQLLRYIARQPHLHSAVGKGLDAYVAVDASGTFNETKRQVGLLRMLQAGVILSDYATLMVEILKDNGHPAAAAVYDAMDMPWAKLVGQISQALRK